MPGPLAAIKNAISKTSGAKPAAKAAVAAKIVAKPAAGKPITKALSTPTTKALVKTQFQSAKPVAKVSPVQKLFQPQTAKGRLALTAAQFIPGVGQALTLGQAFIPSPAPPQAIMAGAAITGEVVTRSWSTGTANFYRTADGFIHVTKKDGTVKRFKPYHSIVLGKRLTFGQVSRATRRLHNLATSFSKILKITRPGGRRRK